MSLDRPDPSVLLIVDGLGIAPPSESNAITLARTPSFDYLLNNFPNTELKASGTSVGLPSGVMGNSEVGHLTIGTGRVTFQNYELINRSIKDKSLELNSNLDKFINYSKINSSSLHLFILLSKGGVHSHIDHLHALINILLKKGVKNCYIHGFTDGRDVFPRSAIETVKQFLNYIKEFPGYKLTDLVGRYFAMDRDKRWERIQVAYDMLADDRDNISDSIVDDPIEEISRRYERGETDEFLKPIILSKEGAIRNNDAILFCNFRPDRARQLTRSFTKEDTPVKTKKIENLYFTTMTTYARDFNLPSLFQSQIVKLSLAEVYSLQNLKQIHIAETEKYAHVTYFINGGKEKSFPNEDRILVPSDKGVATYDLKPQMSTPEITEQVIKAIRSKEDGKTKYDLIIFNIAAPDMVGHTGNLKATIRAVEYMDEAITAVRVACNKYGYLFALTADHGNAEKMREKNKLFTAHTNNPVPFIVCSEGTLDSDGGLADVVPTLFDYLGIKKPREMTGRSLRC